MKRKAAGQRGVDFFYERLGSTSSANITISENANRSEKQQPTIDESSNPVQTDDQNIVEPVQISEQDRVGSTPFERDPGKRKQIWELPLDKQEEARRFYISEGPYQPYMREYPYNGTDKKSRRRFQFSYFRNL
jgi:hypothetical protein